MALYQTSLFIFRRDLRIEDNSALNEALKISEKVIAGFIFDPRQIAPHPYQSLPALQFMLQALLDLDQQFQQIGAKLSLFSGNPTQIIAELKAQQQIQAVFINRDYSPFSRKRDYEIAELCRQQQLDLHYLADALLLEPEQALKADQTPYKVFTSFYNNAKRFPVPLPQGLAGINFIAPTTTFDAEIPAGSDRIDIAHGGRQQALAIFNKLGQLPDYQANRDFPALNATTSLSAHLKFGTCSIREAFYAITEHLGSEHPLLRQLYWRDFFTHIAYHFPQVFGQPFLEKLADLPWVNNPSHFAAWCTGKTGFPIVDAGMRELNTTGFMHNRVRMITASFLVKDLHINWRWGERYFAQHLVDYDPCVNNGNWQWAASTGCDAQPYFRIFNPWLQQQKFDPDCQYIYRWLPELSHLPVKTIHQWAKLHIPGNYPAPIVDHSIESQKAKAIYKQANESTLQN